MRHAGFEISARVVTSHTEFAAALSSDRFDLVLAGYALPGWSGLDALTLLREHGGDLAVLVISAAPDTEAAVACIKQGASDYLLKDHLARLPLAVTRALQERQARVEQAARERRLATEARREAVGRLAEGIARDFSSIFTTVMGVSHSLRDQLPEGSLLADADELYRAGELGAALTRKLQGLSGRQAVRPRVLDLNRLLDESARVLTRLLGESIQLELDPATRPALVSADPGQLEQALLILAVNARDAMPEGGRLRIRTAALTLTQPLVHSAGEIPPGRWVVLAVADEGAGIAPEELEHSFEPFAGRGGLGLPLASGIARQAGGQLVAQSAPGRGSSFELYLPAVDAAPPGAPFPRPLGAPAGQEKILVVEDQPAIRVLVQRVLTRAGYGVLVAGGGEEARALARGVAGPLHLLLIDLFLPGERGPGVGAELRQQHPEARVLFISGSSGLADAASLPGGQHWFLQKPFTPEQLLATVREALDAPAGQGATIAPDWPDS